MSARHCVTIGHGKNQTHGEVFTCPPDAAPAEWMRKLLADSRPEDHDGWWSGCEYTRSADAPAHRSGDHWMSLSACIVDVEFQDANGDRAPLTAEARQDVLDVAINGELDRGVTSFVYMTPRGFRAVSVLDQPEQSRAVAEHAVRGYYKIITDALRVQRTRDDGSTFTLQRDTGRAGFAADKASKNLVQAYALPNTHRSTEPVPRQSQVYTPIEGAKTFTSALLASYAPREPERPPVIVKPLDKAALKRLGPTVSRWIQENVATVARCRAGRNTTLAREAYSIGTLLGALGEEGEAQRETIEAALFDACVQNGDVSEDGERKSRDTIRRQIRKGMSSPRVLPGSEWEQPVPLDGQEVPDFPLETLPSQLRDYVEALADEVQVSPSLTGPLALVAFSAALNGKVAVQATDSWTEGCNLYVAAIARSGGGKSPAFSAIRAPITRHERKLIEGSLVERAKAVKERGVMEKSAKELERDVARARTKGEATPEQEQELDRLTTALATTSVPAEPRLVVEDCTPERLTMLLHEQSGTLAVMSSEAEPFSLMSRYSEGGAFNFDAYLKGWSGESIMQDRIGRARVIIPSARLVLAVCVQPSVVADLMDPRTRLVGRGFVARVLWVTPEDRIGSRRLGDIQAMPAMVRVGYENALTRALELDRGEQPIVLRLSPAAWQAFVSFADEEIEPLAAEYARLGFMSDYLSKLKSNALRLAALLHTIDSCYGTERVDAMPGTITEETMQRAIALARFFLAQAEAVYRPADVALAVRVLDWIKRTKSKGETFTRRDVQTHVLRGKKDVGGALDEALAVLAEGGKEAWIREREPERAGNVPRVFDVTDWLFMSEPDASEPEREPEPDREPEPIGAAS